MKGLNINGTKIFLKTLFTQPSLFIPHLHVQDFSYIPFEELHQSGFRGVIVDKDNTLTLPKDEVFQPNLKNSIESCQHLFGKDKVIIFSNSAGSDDDAGFLAADRLEKELGIRVLRHGCKKPFGFEQAQRELNFPSHQLIVIGDKYSTDIIFGNLNGALTIKTNQLSWDHETFWHKKLLQMENTLYQVLNRFGYKPPHHPLYSKLFPNQD